MEYSGWCKGIISLLSIISTVAFTDTLALFSVANCPEDFRLHCENARITALRMRWANQVSKYPYKQCTIDIQNSYLMATNIILEVMDQEQVNYYGRCFDKTKNVTLTFKNTKGFIFTYVPFEMTRFIASLLLTAKPDIGLISITLESMNPSPLVDEDLFVFGYETSFGVGMHKTGINDLFEEYDMTAVLYLKQNTEDTETIKKPCEERSEETAFCFYINADKTERKHCIKELLLDANDDKEIAKTMDLLKQDPHLRVMILYGFGSDSRSIEDSPLVEPYTVDHEGAFYPIPFERSLSNTTDLTEGNIHDWDFGYSLLDNISGEHSMNGLMTSIYYFEANVFDDADFFKAVQGLDELKDYIAQYEFILKSRFPEWKKGNPLTFEMWQKVPEFLQQKI